MVDINLAAVNRKKRLSKWPEKHLLLFHWLCKSLWLCGLQQTGKLLKRWEYQTTLPVSWETCMLVKKQQFESYMEQLTGSKLGKELWKVCILLPCLFNLYAEYIMWNARLDELQAEIKISRRNINNLIYADDTTLMAESDDELKNFLMRVKEESEKPCLKLSIQKLTSCHPVPSLHGK